MLPPSSVKLSKSPKVEAPSSSTETSRSSLGWPLEIATLVLISVATDWSSSSASIASAALVALGRRAVADALEGRLQVRPGDRLLADRDPPPVGGPLAHQRDPEAGRELLHHLVAGQDELGAALDHGRRNSASSASRPVAEAKGTDQTRPPTRSRASSTVTSAPPARSASAAANPA